MKLLICLALFAYATSAICHDFDKDTDIQRLRNVVPDPEGNYQFGYETSSGIQVQDVGNSISNNLEIRNLIYKARYPEDQFVYETSNDIQEQQVEESGVEKGSDPKANHQFAYDNNEINAVENNIDMIPSLATDGSHPQNRFAYETSHPVDQFASNNIEIQAAGNNFNKEAVIHRLTNEASDAEGNYQYAYETSNGIQAQAAGNSVGVSGSVNYISPEGKRIGLTYTADEDGYHPVGDHLPTPPPMPDYIRRSLEYIRSHPFALRKKYQK